MQAFLHMLAGSLTDLIKWSDDLMARNGLKASELGFQGEGLVTRFEPDGDKVLGLTFERCVCIMQVHKVPQELETVYDEMEGYDPTTIVVFSLEFEAFKGPKRDDTVQFQHILAVCDVVTGKWFSLGLAKSEGYRLSKDAARLCERFHLPSRPGVRSLSDARGKALVGRMLKAAMIAPMKERSQEEEVSDG